MKRITVLLSSLFAVSGCDLLGGGASDNTMNHYIEGYNKLIDAPADFAGKCLGMFPEGGPVPGKKYRSMLMSVRADSELQKAKEAFKNGGDDSEIGKFATQAATSMDTLVKTCKKIDSYYDAEDYKDDKDGTQVKAMYDEALSSYQTFRTGISGMDKILEEFSDKQSLAALDDFDKDTPSYVYRVALMNAKKVVAAAQQGDVDKFKSAADQFSQNAKTLDSFDQDWFSSYKDMSTRFANETRKLSRNLEGDKASETLMGGANDLVSAYNTLVSMMDSMQTLEANGLAK